MKQSDHNFAVEKIKQFYMNLKRLPLSLTLAALATCYADMEAGIIKGTVYDGGTDEPLIGASVIANPGSKGTATDIDGNYSLRLPAGKHNLSVKYIGYRDTVITRQIPAGDEIITLDIPMNPNATSLAEVTVTAVARKDTESAMIEEEKQSDVVQTGVSAQQIARTQDKDASEVIRRVPGISIMDDKFVMVRGLSQRYNNVWLNGGAVPSSEADSRAFSFDIIPSSQLDNIVIVKSPAPEYPSDFTGGFVMVRTKYQPAKSGFDISVGTSFNDMTHFRNFKYYKGGGKGYSGGFDSPLLTYSGFRNRIDPLNNGFNNDWEVYGKKPIGDLKVNASYSNRWRFESGSSLGLLASINYSDAYRTLLDMENSLYGPYDVTNDSPVYLRKATDNQYTNDRKIGALLNLSFLPQNGRHRFEWKNIYNRIVKNRYSDREGFNSQPDNIRDMEYYYSTRNTFNTQFTGRHEFSSSSLWDWSAGYAYSDRDMPDRRLIQLTDRTDQRMGIYRISREFTRLRENTASLNTNYRHEFDFGAVKPVLKAGLYGEYRNRTYDVREFQYGWQPDNNLPDGFMFNPDVAGEVLIPENYGPDKLYLYENVNFLNSYKASNRQLSGYVGVNIPWRSFTIYGGVRYEYVDQLLRMNTRQSEESLQDTHYYYKDFFPSVNVSYRFNDMHQVRAAYGRSTNRPEFRELAPTVYYDFDLGSSVMGNYDLKAAYIQNIDLRYEWYPSRNEIVSVALFYKKFTNPIEWTYTVAGGTDLIYSYINAKGADNYGFEVDIRKNLGFIGLDDFSLSFNGSLIKSTVTFDKGNNIDRPMQGQSPYLINIGLFYNRDGWSAAVLYNRIGKRIVGVGNKYGTGADGNARNIPNSYEMPRNSLDISFGKKFGHWELKASVRDVLAERYLFKQIEEVEVLGKNKSIEEITRSYKPGRNFNLSITYSF